MCSFGDVSNFLCEDIYQIRVSPEKEIPIVLCNNKFKATKNKIQTQILRVVYQIRIWKSRVTTGYL